MFCLVAGPPSTTTVIPMLWTSPHLLHPTWTSYRLGELFAVDAIRALIETLVNLAFVVQILEKRLHALGVAGFRRPDEVVVRDLERAPHRPPRLIDQPVGPGLGADAVGLGRAQHLLAVLVGSGEEPDRLPTLPMPAGQNVAGHRRVRMPDVGGIVDVVDRRREVKSLRIGHTLKVTDHPQTRFEACSVRAARQAPGSACF